jgi:hypothetical protein
MKRSVALSVALVVACTTERPSEPSIKVPVAPGPLAATVVVSNPVLGRIGASATMQNVVYVSLPPATLAEFSSVVIVNERTRSAATPVLTQGGFDPVAIPGIVGDTLDIGVFEAGATSSHTRVAIDAKRAPRVVRTNPEKGATDVPLWSVFEVVFSEPIDAASLTGSSLQLRRGSALVSGQVTFGDPAHLIARFTPDASLASASGYELAVTADIHDLDGQSPEACRRRSSRLPTSFTMPRPTRLHSWGYALACDAST